ncbi:MAG: hypothetical protein KGZ64_08510 [Thermaerobacter sp.]|nr:hypothetical protein [Thermaerobacter sp.]
MANSYNEYVTEILTLMKSWRQLPKYQLERRIDVLLAPFIGEIIAGVLGGEAVFVIPEFPLKKENNNESNNSDYLVLLKSSDNAHQWILVVLKTDHSSIKAAQLKYYQTAQKEGFATLYEKTQQIATSKNANRKHRTLQSQLEHYPKDGSVRVVYLAPEKAREKIDKNFLLITFREACLRPSKKHHEVWQALGPELAQMLEG